MNVAKWLLLGLLALPMAELAAFIAVAAVYGFALALLLLVAGSVAGGLILRHAGGQHIARMRVAMQDSFNHNNFSALRADGTGGLTLLGGFLLAVPGFITDVMGLLVLLVPLWARLGEALGRRPPQQRADGVVDLEPEQWRRVDDPALPRHPTGDSTGEGLRH
ncbi:MAG: FxsA family protein [Proteobacteria bacterium]|nr:FxsA family protein [Pseudomonadota bacterium]